MKEVSTPLINNHVFSFKAGEIISFSGTIYTARDQAHKKIVSLLNKGRGLPFSLKGQIIYYCGPTPAPEGCVIGSCGPTTSERMDGFTEPLFKEGLAGMIGKGKRSPGIRKIVKKYKGIYFLAPSGCGALLAQRVLSKKAVAFKDLGTEAIFRLEVKDFPLVVGIDARGNDIYSE